MQTRTWTDKQQGRPSSPGHSPIIHHSFLTGEEGHPFHSELFWLSWFLWNVKPVASSCLQWCLNSLSLEINSEYDCALVILSLSPSLLPSLSLNGNESLVGKSEFRFLVLCVRPPSYLCAFLPWVCKSLCSLCF